MAIRSTHPPDPRGEDESSAEAIASERRRREGVGALLRQTRIAYGGDLEATAAALRIRPAYLVAIEQGQYRALPGAVYALGFVRAYAVHLGLDGDEAVRRFKNEAAGFERPRGLAFPMPLTKRSIPGGPMLLAALVLAVCGYGLWYYLSTGDHARPDEVSAVPAQLLPPTPANAAPAALAAPPQMTAAAQAAAAAAAPSADVLSPLPAPPEGRLPALSDTTADAAAAAPAAVSAGSLVTAVALPPPAPAAAQPDAKPAASVPAPAPAAAPAPPNAPASPAPAPAAAAPPPATATQLAAAPAATAPRIFGAVNGPFRIAIRAVSDSWLQVRDGSDAVVAQRLLHQGDFYRVPEQPGLVLRTGNAAGLEITVDGKPVKPLGGTVRNNILLDPDRLIAGTAASD